MSQISKESRKVFSKNVSVSITIGLLAGLLITAITLLNFLSSIAGFVAFCLLAIPVIFACHLSYAAVTLGLDVKLSSFFIYFRQYFSYGFVGVFRLIRAALLTLAVLVGSLITCGLIASIVFFRINPDGFAEVVNAFYDYAYLGSDTYTLNELLSMNGGILTMFILISIVPTYVISSLFFIYKVSLRSLNIYFRMNVPKFNPMIVKAIEDHFYYINKWKVKRDFFKENWFILIIVLLFAAGGIVLGINLLSDPTQVANLAVSTMALSSILFFPIYFYNMHGIYSKYEIEFKKSSLEISKKIYEKVKNDYEMMGKDMEQEKEEFEKAINELEEESKENDDENNRYE